MRLRRTWPQRLIICFNLVIIGVALYTARTLGDVNEAVGSIPRVEFPPGVLVDNPPPVGAPLTFVLVGADSAAGLDPDDPQAVGRPAANLADAIMLLRVDPTAQQAWMVSIPRDLWVEIPGHSEQKVNAAYSLGQEPLLVETISEAFDVPVNHFVSVDFAGFAAVVDQLGGVPVNFPYPARDEGSFLSVPVAGCYRLNGLQALEYVRSRKYEEDRGSGFERVGLSSDLERNRRQQDFLILALQRAVDRGITANRGSIADTINAAKDAIVLDEILKVQQLIDLAQQFSDFNPESLTRFALPVSDDIPLNALRLIEGPQTEAILDVFRGRSTVSLDVASSSGSDDEADALAEALDLGPGFGAMIVDGAVEASRSELRFSADRRSDAVEVYRHLDGVDAVEVDEAGVLTLVVTADDEVAVRLLARSPDDADRAVPAVAEAPVTATTVTSAAPSTTEDADPEAGDGDEPTVTTTTELVIGKPPEGTDCSQRLEDG